MPTTSTTAPHTGPLSEDSDLAALARRITAQLTLIRPLLTDRHAGTDMTLPPVRSVQGAPDQNEIDRAYVTALRACEDRRPGRSQ